MKVFYCRHACALFLISNPYLFRLTHTHFFLSSCIYTGATFFHLACFLQQLSSSVIKSSNLHMQMSHEGKAIEIVRMKFLGQFTLPCHCDKSINKYICPLSIKSDHWLWNIYHWLELIYVLGCSLTYKSCKDQYIPKRHTLQSIGVTQYKRGNITDLIWRLSLGWSES